MNLRPAWVLAAALLALPSVHAEQVGRIEADLPGWTLVTRYDSKLTFNGGEYAIPLRHALFQLAGDGKVPRALLLLTSTDAGNRQNVNWVSQKCPAPGRNFYTRLYSDGAVKSQYECLIVNGSFAPAKLFQPDSEVAAGLQAQGLQFFKAGYSIRTTVALHGGTFLHVNLMAPRGFAGLPDAPVEATELQEVPKALVAWGEALHGAAKRSALSMGGALELPPIQFSR